MENHHTYEFCCSVVFLFFFLENHQIYELCCSVVLENRQIYELCCSVVLENRQIYELCCSVVLENRQIYELCCSVFLENNHGYKLCCLVFFFFLETTRAIKYAAQPLRKTIRPMNCDSQSFLENHQAHDIVLCLSVVLKNNQACDSAFWR